MFLVDEFVDSWNYTFLVIMLIAIGLGTFMTIRKQKKSKLSDRREKRNNQ